MHSTIHRLVALAASVLAASAAGAQSADEQSAYVAISYTTVGGLPPLAPLRTLGSSSKRATGVTLVGRLGHMSRQGGLSLTSYGVGVEVPRGRTQLGATLAYLSASCGFEWAGDSDCSGDIMIGGSARTLLSSRPLDGSTLLVGLDANAGYSPRQGESALAFGVSLPTALAFRSSNVRIMPFLAPGLGYGRLGHVAYFEDESPTSHGSIMMMIGGGLGLEFGTSGVGANVGFQRVLKSSGGATQLGIGFVWKGAGRA